MSFRIFKNILKQGFQGMWRNRGMGIASVGSITAVLIILGMVLIMILSINNIVSETQNKFDEIQIFLEDDIKKEEIETIGNKIKSSDGVKNVKFLTKEEAMKDMKEDWGEEGDLLEGLEENPLPNSYIIQLEDIEYADAVVENIKGMKGIEEVKYYRDIIEKLLSTANYIRITGIIIIVILMAVSVFIISNTIKITVTARKREVNIMKYVGATNGYIRGPFIIEGILLGLIGALLSILIVNYGYDYLFKVINEKLYVLFTVYLVAPHTLLKDISIMFIAIGVGIGTLGSLVSLKRFLNA
ncbi:permease-like cell division protein FtsX [Anaerosalibacter bizertensis]|nr:permease-like cell division protein FtsX [Anaerosalibacter bizertensis]MBV1817576.1 permease-like cell division protein FtsX [Bacteroidales bacterium MSK.15.36]MCG4564070.1 permease-like cell division protein FtsX [Anaerosalibacter bizertensis]MCG4582876.1 permease-like cell division protein FtsX [Anaerosalibacter bizertensis]